MTLLFSFTERLLHPFSVRSFFRQRYPRFATIISTHQRSQWFLLRKISGVLNKYSMDFGTTGGVVLPASEDHIDEAIDAVRAGAVIAVPTDTLYGFSCDACAREETVAVLHRFSLEEAS
ncbi:yrdC domain-containing protein, mitochondrial isoform X1 [Iris pallida]|uniref:YrdC domain-containing protein, mitochondrial isoform X1 n=1 Tax=Iris pallida TaxID=29817 RepID=A0AAX6EFZ4_IRIPA|nr:yrdC domain-containing protein, mitochondrial isoform X1 [Iris pallida]